MGTGYLDILIPEIQFQICRRDKRVNLGVWGNRCCAVDDSRDRSWFTLLKSRVCFGRISLGWPLNFNGPRGQRNSWKYRQVSFGFPAWKQLKLLRSMKFWAFRELYISVVALYREKWRILPCLESASCRNNRLEWQSKWWGLIQSGAWTACHFSFHYPWLLHDVRLKLSSVDFARFFSLIVRTQTRLGLRNPTRGSRSWNRTEMSTAFVNNPCAVLLKVGFLSHKVFLG